jgi:hypothetical protein
MIPANSLKNCLSEAAKFMSISVPGKGKATYTKNFEAGVMVAKSPSLGIKAANVQHEALFLPSDGKRGGSKRVMKYYPNIPEWECEGEYSLVRSTRQHVQPSAIGSREPSMSKMARSRPRRSSTCSPARTSEEER